MRINFLLPAVKITGGNRVVFEYANRLSDRGHDVTVLYPAVPPRIVDPWYSYRARWHQLTEGLDNLVTDTGVEWFDLNTSVELLPVLSTHLMPITERFVPDADVTIATSWETAYPVAALSDSKGECAYFVQHYEIWETWNSTTAWEQLNSELDTPETCSIEMQDISPPDKTARREKRLVDRTYSLPLAKITISSWLRELMESKFDQDVVATVPNSVNHETFYPDSTQNDHGLSVLLPYRTQTWKGQGETRQLVENLQQRDDTRIMLFGPERGFGWAADSVDTFSNLSDSELRQLYSSADIFVLPSWTEGFGLPVLEAMACECAVVTTNVGTVLDYTHEEFPAAIVPPRDASELTSATVELLADATKRETLQRQGREFVTDFSWEDATNRFENALYKIIE